MANIGAEVGQKMRSAIKAKLLELNCYVDDELPDYVMVMVANKRTKSQMKEDLQLFLAAKTTSFVDWLHIVLKKLKEVTVTNPEVYKKAVKRKSDEIANVNVKKEKKDKKLEKKVDDEKPVSGEDSSFKSLTDDLPINANKLAEQRKIIIMKENQSNNSTEVMQDSFNIPLLSEVNMSTEEELEDIERKIKSVKSRLGLLVDSDDEEECINLKAEPDELFESDKTNEKKLVPRKIQLIDTDFGNETVSRPEINEESPPKRPERTKITFSNEETSVKRKSILERLGKRRLSVDQNETARLKKSRISVADFHDETENVSRVSREKDRKSLEKKSDFRNRRDGDKTKESVLNRLGVMSKVSIPQKPLEEPEEPVKGREVASMVKIKPRVIPYDAPQANKNLLLKAVAEAQRSIAQTPKVGSNFKLDALYTKKYKEKIQDEPDALFTRKYKEKAPEDSDALFSKKFKEKAQEDSDALFTKKFKEKAQENSDALFTKKFKEKAQEDSDALFTKKFNEKAQEESDALFTKKFKEKAQEDSDALFTKKFKEKVQEDSDALFTKKFKEKAQEESHALFTKKFKEKAQEESHALFTKKFKEKAQEDSDVFFLEKFKEKQHEDSDALFTKKFKEERKLPEKKNKTKKILPPVREPVQEEEDIEYVVVSPKFASKTPPLPEENLSENCKVKQQFIVTLDGIEKTKFEDLKDEENPPKPSIKSRLDKKRSPSPIIFDKVTSSVKTKLNIPDKLPVVHAPSSIKNKEKCRYWPTCRQGEKCEFVHPVTNCEMFPHCKFGDKCLFLHPICKFGSSCTRRDCCYSHSPGGKVAVARITPSSASNKQTCKYFPNCTNLSCAFYHPKPCKFGKFCKKLECNFSHGYGPTKSSLTWRSK